MRSPSGPKWNDPKISEDWTPTGWRRPWPGSAELCSFVLNLVRTAAGDRRSRLVPGSMRARRQFASPRTLRSRSRSSSGRLRMPRQAQEAVGRQLQGRVPHRGACGRSPRRSDLALGHDKAEGDREPAKVFHDLAETRSASDKDQAQGPRSDAPQKLPN